VKGFYEIAETVERTKGGVVICIESDGIAFQVRDLRCIASNGGGWDHLSVSRPDRIPNWDQMESMRKIVFARDEYAYQLGVPDRDHINFHPRCLHWWRPQDREIPVPPKWMVGPVGAIK
jgi:hypothetical protein